MKKLLAAISLLLFCLGCVNKEALSKLPDGYNIWVMNSKEIYVSCADNIALVGPLLKQVGITRTYIVATSEPAAKSQWGYLGTSGYSLIEITTRKVTTQMTEAQAKQQLAKVGESMPLLLDFNNYELATNH